MATGGAVLEDLLGLNAETRDRARRLVATSRLLQATSRRLFERVRECDERRRNTVQALWLWRSVRKGPRR